MRRYGDETISAGSLDESKILDGSTLHHPPVLDRVRSLEPDLGVSIMFGFILSAEILDVFPQDCINL